jgi:hypothetical protein
MLYLSQTPYIARERRLATIGAKARAISKAHGYIFAY